LIAVTAEFATRINLIGFRRAGKRRGNPLPWDDAPHPIIMPLASEQSAMYQNRRNVLRGAVSTAALSVAVAAGILSPRQVFASNAKGGVTDTLRALQVGNPIMTNAIQIHAPDIAENGASVFIDFHTALPDVDALIVFVDRNPQPLIAAFQIAPEVVPSLQMRIKIAQTANIWVIARSGGQFFKSTRAVKVTTGGCGIGVN
jgi:sulfur-oxidizing protein SoxY